MDQRKLDWWDWLNYSTMVLLGIGILLFFIFFYGSSIEIIEVCDVQSWLQYQNISRWNN